MKNLVRLLMALCLLPAAEAAAQGGKANPAGMVLERSLPAQVDPGAQMDVTVTLTAEPSDTIRALGVVETLPEGVAFVSVSGVGDTPSPPIAPAEGATNRLDFAWIDTPTFPVSLKYTLSIPDTLSGTQEISGYVEYRLEGGSLQSDTTVSQFLVGEEDPNPAGVELERIVPGEVAPGVDFDVTLTITAQDATGLLALGVFETLPDGWDFVSVRGAGGSGAPPIFLFDDATNQLEFGWIDVPALPYSCQYTVSPPPDISGAYAISGYVEYRLDDGPLQSGITVSQLTAGEMDTNPLNVVLGRTVPGQVAPGAIFYVTITMNAQQTGVLAGPRLLETLPEGWMFISAESVGGEPVPDTTVFSQETGELEFTWNTVPELPYTFQYILSAPNDLASTAEILGYVAYESGGLARQSSIVVSQMVANDTNTAPTITLLGANPLQWDQGVPYVDPGWTAADAEDGDLTDAVVPEGTVDFMAPGTYTVAYIVEDSMGDFARAERSVEIIEQPCKGVFCCAGGGAGRSASSADLLVMALAALLLAVYLVPNRSPR